MMFSNDWGQLFFIIFFTSALVLILSLVAKFNGSKNKEESEGKRRISDLKKEEFINKLIKKASFDMEISLCAFWRIGKIDRKKWENLNRSWFWHIFEVRSSLSEAMDTILQEIIQYFTEDELFEENVCLRFLADALDFCREAERYVAKKELPDWDFFCRNF